MSLINAVWNGRLNNVRRFIQAGANVNARGNNGWTVLRLAALQGRTQIVHELIQAGADVNARGADRWTALMTAAGSGHTQIVHELIQAGANVNARDNDGWTALMFAARWGHTQTVRELLKSGAKNWMEVYNRTRNQTVRNAIKNHASKIITRSMRTATTRRRVATIATLMKKTPINRGLTTRIMSTLKRG